MKKTINILTTLIVIGSSILSVQRYARAQAETQSSYVDTHTNVKPYIGCYKTNDDERCVETTYIDCSHNLETTVALYGPVIGSACDDINYLKAKIERKNKIIRNQTRTYRRVVERLTGQNLWK